MSKTIYRKNQYVISSEQAEKLLSAMDDFVNNPVIGKGQPRLDPELMKIWNSGQRLDWEWSEKTKVEYERKKALEDQALKKLALFKSDNDAWKNAIVRHWRNIKLVAWIDDTFTRPLLYNLTVEQETERVAKRQELLEWPALPELGSYKTDEELDVLQPSAPSWIDRK